MEKTNEINHLMTGKLNNIRDCSNRIDEIVKQGKISERLGEYAKELAIIDFVSEESVALADQNDIYSTGKSLADGRLRLDRIASLYFDTKFLKEGIPNYYLSLLDLARERYNKAVSKCEEILEWGNERN